MGANLLNKAKWFLFSRQRAYQRVFRGTGMDGAVVLEDLAQFCRAHTSTAHADPHIAARLDGRREVWLRIQTHLQLSDDALWKLHGNPTLTNQGENV